MITQNFIRMSCLFHVLCNGMVTDGSQDYAQAFVVFNYNSSNGSESSLGSLTKEEGNYGRHSPKANATGVVRLPYPFDENDMYGCDSSYSHVNTSEAWIALVARGDCKFSEKILNAQNRNASGILVYDFEENSSPLIMSHEGAEEIVAVSINYHLGRQAALLVNQGYTVHVTITTGSRSNKENFSFEKTSIIFVSVSFMILILVSLAWLIFYYIQRFRLVHDQNKTMRRRQEMAKMALDKIPSRSLKREDDVIIDGSVCAICLDNYKSEDNVRDLPCSHIFHKKCIDPWIQTKETCPMCKINVLKAIGAKEHDNPSLVSDYAETEVTTSVATDDEETPRESPRSPADDVAVTQATSTSGDTGRIMQSTPVEV